MHNQLNCELVIVNVHIYGDISLKIKLSLYYKEHIYKQCFTGCQNW